MKHQHVSVDFWAMAKSMLMYVALTGAGWMLMRLFNAVYSLPRRLRTTQDNMQATLEEMQRRYPNLNITEEDLKNADEEYEKLVNEMDSHADDDKTLSTENKEDTPDNEEEKKNM